MNANTAAINPADIGSQIAIIAVLLLINAFFAAAEIAMVSVSDVRMRMLADQGDRRARLVLAITDNSTRFLATIQVGITFAGFFTSATAAQSLAAPMTAILLPLVRDPALAQSAALITITILIALISLIFGELLPKRLAIRNAEAIALASARPIRFLGKLASPIVKFLSASTNVALTLMGVPIEDAEEIISTEEIKAMVDAGRAGGSVGEQERRIIHGAVELSHIPARAIMVPRVGIQYLKLTTPLEEAYRIVSENAHTRLPVCHEDLDNIAGILHVKDLIQPLEGLRDRPPTLQELLRPVHYVPETKLARDLLADMKKNRLHLVIVRDEFGGTAGLITLEDVLEELVGEIRDEYDAEEEREFRRISSHEGIFKLRASLATVNNELDLQLPRDEVATLAGLFLEELQRPPEAGDRIEIDGVLLEVLEEGQRVRVCLAPPLEASTAD